jgi:nitroreductase
VIVQDEVVREELGRIYHEANADYVADLRRRGEAGDAAALRSWRSASILTEQMGQVPIIVVLAFERHEWWGHDPYGEASTYGSVYPAAWSFQLACRSRGLVTCSVTAHVQRGDEVTAALGLPSHFEHACMFAVGHPDGEKFQPARRSPLDEVVALDRWS